MPSFSEVIDLFWGLVGPWVFLSQSFSYLPGTIFRLIRAGDFRRLRSWSRIQDAWFSAFWGWAGPNIRDGNGDRIAALLEGRVTEADVVDEPVHPPVSGVVLEVGPGSGMWVNLFSKVDKPAASGAKGVRRKVVDGVTRIYGVEPNTEVHPALRKHIAEAGLEGTYEIVPVGIESLSDSTTWEGKIERGSVDCIFSILCLCSIPEPEKNIAELYSYLKKGGRWYLYEHVEVSQKWPLLQLYQRFVNLVWPRALNGCQLCRNTGKTIKSVGPWEKIDLARPPVEPWYQLVPHIFGTLTK
ncbi:methyltransferase domain-containing protein [Colletotrichum truncatum]|uniref:Methyltransferase domain-containing protein n=1 Tax=Colletotrichum truncatum TaxID=5467 RepID=A0ACC3ZFE2_COLTU|nr:methyltransferase domain-containing protein [Colletotrichum truncatum]KAF6801746.1 methyltransferase domain-containing protein [Colletotrichum truncatum]